MFGLTHSVRKADRPVLPPIWVLAFLGLRTRDPRSMKSSKKLS
jgi:hypothetical protein